MRVLAVRGGVHAVGHEVVILQHLLVDRIGGGLAEDGMTMLCVTHEMGFARQVAERVLFLDGGMVIEDSPPEEFFNAPKSPRAKAFLAQIVH